jgi:hypothetical protein
MTTTREHNQNDVEEKLEENELFNDDVRELVENDSYADAAKTTVGDLYADACADADTTLEETKYTRVLKDRLAQLTHESDDPKKVVNAAKSASGSAAQTIQKPRDKIADIIDDATRDILDKKRSERLKNGEGLSVQEGIGLDTYLEKHLEEVVRQESTDSVDDPVLRWRFNDGVTVETGEAVHHDFYALFRKLASATNKRLVPELASEQAEEELRSDEEADGAAYAELSLGPTSRPWNTDNELWSRAISGLVEENIRKETVVGPRTDAWESIQACIRSGRAVKDLSDAVENAMMYIDEDAEEVWIPTSMVDNAADEIETSRRAVQAELAERGVTSSNLSGERVSEAVSRRNAAIRFWRLDLSEDAVPSPDVVLNEIEDPVEKVGGENDLGAAAADGGPPPSRGSERFGRAAEDETEKEASGDRDDDAAADGDGGDEE